MLQKYDPRNDDLIIYVNGELLPRSEAKVSVFDSVVQGGDAVWEGLRLYNGRIFCLDKHLERLQNSAHALAFANVPDNDTITDAIRQTLLANEMYDDVHIRPYINERTKNNLWNGPSFKSIWPNFDRSC